MHLFHRQIELNHPFRWLGMKALVVEYMGRREGGVNRKYIFAWRRLFL